MTRKKAIEAAVERIIYGRRDVDVIRRELAEMHDQGRVAGLREAARIMVKRDQWLPTGAQAEIRDLANALAKKARGK